MISLQKNFLFIHLPKTGGNSVQKALLKYSEDRVVSINQISHDVTEDFEIRNDKYKISKHSTLTRYKAVLNPSIYKNLFKFTTIRNPWDRMISFYFSPHRNTPEWNREEFKLLVKRIRPLRHFIVEKRSNSLFLRKFDNFRYLLRTPHEKLDSHIDMVLKYENLENDFESLCNKLDINYIKLPILNKSHRRHYSHYYDKELIEIVRNRFWEEIEFGNYKFETE